MTERINALLSEVESLAAADEKELEALRIKYLGKKGLLNDLMADFRNVPAEQKRETGQKINALKTALQDKLNALRQSLGTKEDSHDVGKYSFWADENPAFLSLDHCIGVREPVLRYPPSLFNLSL